MKLQKLAFFTNLENISNPESSRLRELPPQSLTESDMNLSIHPDLIDQPIVLPVASAQTGKSPVWQCAQASKTLCVCDGVEPVILSLTPKKDPRDRPARDLREVLNGILWILRTGAPWKDLPQRYPP